ncbi:glycine oxidase ThiO [Arthrobacter sp. JSM 101049]|uniref:glycine oxidase ThiO n=1 Tax=Arthrobacter sp. JSM 101049 TaxID=929097 RepID=UPI0035648950
MHCAVVGAGIIGLSIGWELARAGHQVSLIDPAPGTGATHAAAGMLAAITEYHFQEQDLLRLSVPAADAWPRWARALEQATGRPTGFRAGGTLVVAADGADREALAELAAAQRAAALDIGEVGTTAARRLEPLLAPRLAGAFSAPGDGQADPRRTAAALLAALAAESRVRWVRQEATAVVPSDHGSAVDCGRPGSGRRETVPADEVILATGTGLPGGAVALPGLPAGLRLAVRPVHGDVLRLRPTPAFPRPAGVTVRALVSGRAVYVLPRSDGEVVLGATEREDGHTGVSVEGTHRLLRDALRIMPGLGHFELAETTARTRPGTPDNLPLLGRIGPGLIAATGFHRHGVLLSVAAASAVRSLIGHRGDRPHDAPARHPPPLATLAPDALAPFDPWRFS